MHRPNNGTARRKPPARQAQVVDLSRISPAVVRLAEGHAERILRSGAAERDVSDQVAKVLGIPPRLAEAICNRYFLRKIIQERRWRQGAENVRAWVDDAAADLAEDWRVA